MKHRKQDPITVLISFLPLAVNVYHVAQCTLSARRENQKKAKEGFINVSHQNEFIVVKGPRDKVLLVLKISSYTRQVRGIFICK